MYVSRWKKKKKNCCGWLYKFIMKFGYWFYFWSFASTIFRPCLLSLSVITKKYDKEFSQCGSKGYAKWQLIIFKIRVISYIFVFDSWKIRFGTDAKNTYCQAFNALCVVQTKTKSILNSKNEITFLILTPEFWISSAYFLCTSHACQVDFFLFQYQ